MHRSPSRPSRSAACLCAACGRVVDAADPTCAKCGHARPDAGWKPLGLPRRAVEPEPETDEFDFGAVAGPPADAPPENVVPMSAPLPPRPLPSTTAGLPVAPSPTPPASRRRPEPLRLQVGPPDLTAPDAGDPSTRPYAGRYRVEEALSAAPGTTRHLAVQEPAVRRVVLTVLRRGRAADVQQGLEARFLRDARVLARLRHPALAAVHDVGRAADGTCFATEEAPYGPTFAELAAARALPADRLLTVAANVSAALATMHEAGVVHRCVRADAVVVGPGVWRSGTGAEPTQLGRYGWHVLPEEIAEDDDPAAAVVWAPEVLAGEEPDEAADIYAVGVLLHHGLVGRPLHVGTAAEIRAAAARAPAPRLVRTGDPLGNRLCDVAERCLAVSPDHRYPSARALLRELEELARPPAPQAAPVRTGMSFLGVAAAALTGALVPTLALLAGAAWRASEPAVTPVYVEVPRAEAPARAPAPVAPGTVPVAPAMDVVATPAADPGAADPGAADPGAVTAGAGAGAVPAPAVESVAATPTTDAPAPRERRRVSRAPAVDTTTTEPGGTSNIPAPATSPTSPASPVVAAAAPAAPAAPAPATAAPVAAEERPTAAAKPAAGPTVPGAAALSGLWVGRAPGGTLALDLVVAPDGRVTGRARRGDRAGEGAIVGRVSAVDGALRLELQVTDATGTESFSGVVADGEVSGRIQAGGKPAGRFTARR